MDKAQSLATEALMYLPNDSALHFNLANTLGKKKIYEKAEHHFLTAIQLKKNEPLYHTNLGNVYFILIDYYNFWFINFSNFVYFIII